MLAGSNSTTFSFTRGKPRELYTLNLDAPWIECFWFVSFEYRAAGLLQTQIFALLDIESEAGAPR